LRGGVPGIKALPSLWLKKNLRQILNKRQKLGLELYQKSFMFKTSPASGAKKILYLKVGKNPTPSVGLSLIALA
jgi:hypothetical protein